MDKKSNTGCGLIVTIFMFPFVLASKIIFIFSLLAGAVIWGLARLGSTPRNPDGTPKKSRLTIDGS